MQYMCVGSTKHLVSRMAEVDFKKIVDKYIDNGGIYIGVSAGSVCTSGKYENGLGFIKNVLDVHCELGSPNGDIATIFSRYGYRRI